MSNGVGLGLWAGPVTASSLPLLLFRVSACSTTSTTATTKPCRSAFRTWQPPGKSPEASGSARVGRTVAGQPASTIHLKIQNAASFTNHNLINRGILVKTRFLGQRPISSAPLSETLSIKFPRCPDLPMLHVSFLTRPHVLSCLAHNQQKDPHATRIRWSVILRQKC